MKGEGDAWENELWSHINAGDGIRCPFSDSCRLDKDSVSCFNNKKQREATQKLHKFVDSEEIDFTDYKSINLKFSECTKQGIIFKLVTKLAQKYLNKNWHNSIPVPDNLILNDCQNFPIEVRYVRLKANHGALWRLNDSWLIHLNNNDTYARQRFTLYHEIFHILSHCQGRPIFKKSTGADVNYNEIVADHFAANILLPRDLVVSKWSENKDINKLASIFCVPGTVMWGALRMNGLI